MQFMSDLIYADLTPLYYVPFALFLGVFTIFLSVWMAIKFSLRNLNQHVEKLEKNLYSLFNPYILTYEAPMQELISLCREINYKLDNYNEFSNGQDQTVIMTSKLHHNRDTGTTFYITPYATSYKITLATEQKLTGGKNHPPLFTINCKKNHKVSPLKLASIPVITTEKFLLKK